MSWSWRRVFQARALVARPGAQLARGAAAVPVYASAAVSRSWGASPLGRTYRIPSVTIGFLSVV